MNNIKQILQNEITYHQEELTKHKNLSEMRGGSKREEKKAMKHFHKKHQTIKIARILGFGVCELCGGLR